MKGQTMDLALLTSVFGWMTLLNTAILLLSTLALLFGQRWILPIHARLSGLDEPTLQRAYFDYLAKYKIAVLMLNLVPWLALLIVA